MKYLKKTFYFTLVCLLLLTSLNSLFFLFNEIIPYLFNEYSFIEYIGVGIIYGIVIFILVLIGGVNYSFVYIPLLHLFLSLLIMLYA